MGGFEYRGDAAFRRWLYLQATRKILQRYQHLTRQKRDPAREVGAHELDQLLEHYGAFGTPSRRAAAREEVERIEALLGGLPPDQCEAVAMSRILGLSYADIAETMGRSESAVRGLVARGLAQLAAHL